MKGLQSMAVGLLAACLGATAAIAGSPEDCAAIDWKPDILARFQDIDRACQEVVEREGRSYVRFTVEFVRRHNDGGIEVLMQRRGAEPVRRIFSAPATFSVDSPTGLSDFKFAELERGEILDVFIALDRVSNVTTESVANHQP